MAKKKEENTEQSSVYDVIKLIGATEIVDEIQRKFRLAASTTDVEARRSTTVSTGLLMTDIVLNGGIYPAGWYTFFGGEGSAKCLVGDSLVPTSKGIYSLEELYKQSDIVTWDGFNPFTKKVKVTTHKGTNRNIEQVFIGKDFTTKVMSSLGDKLEGTKDHKLWVFDSQTKEYLFKKIGNLKRSDYLPKSLGTNLFNHKTPKIKYVPTMSKIYNMDLKYKQQSFKFPTRLTEGLAELLGWYVAEGVYGSAGFTMNDKRMMTRFKEIFAYEFGYDPIDRASNSIATPTPIKDYLEQFLGGKEILSGDRYVPSIILKSPKKFQVAFLRSLYEGDGGIDGTTIKYTTISERLAYEVKAMLDNMGILSYVRTSNTWATNGSENQVSKIAYSLYVPINHAERFATNIGFLSKRKTSKLESLVNQYNPEYHSRNGFAEMIPAGDLLFDFIKQLSVEFPCTTARGSSVGKAKSPLLKGIDVKAVVNRGNTLISRYTWSRVKQATASVYDRMSKDLQQLFDKISYQEQFIWASIESKKQTRLVKQIFDLSIKGTHSYHVNGLIGHNSSTMMNILSSVYGSNVPLIDMRDAEGSTSADYIETMARSSGVAREFDVKKAFGVSDPKTGKWVIPPRIRYTSDNSLEGTWKSISAILKRLPDKAYIDGDWWLLFDRTKENISKFKGQGNKKIGDQYNKIAIKSLDGGSMQALFIVDSLPALVAEADDEDEGTNAMAISARGHAKHIPKVKGRLKRKHCTILVVNQIRLNPGAMMGNPEYEPGGQAPKFASDVRIKHTARSVPHGKGSTEEEDSVQFKSGVDTYRYIHLRAIKNKYGTPNVEAWHRLWLSDPIGKAHGFCPVWDTYQYLVATGQLEGTMGRGFTINLGKWTSPKLKWLDFKMLILLEGKALKEECQRLGIDKNPKIRETCFKQIRSGEGLDLYYQTISGLNEEDEVPYDEWDDSEIVDEVVERGLMDKKNAKKSKIKDLIKLLEADDLNEEDDEEGTDEDDE